MEALSLGGVDTVLFLRIPDEALLSRFADCRAVGLAGTSRSESPQWMDENLTPALQWLRSLDGAVCHYKVCSTFDSSPTVGSIGRAIEIGRRVFEQGTVPIVVGAPQLRRYTAFRQSLRRLPGRHLPHRPASGDEPASRRRPCTRQICCGTFPGRRTCVHRSSTWQGSRRTRPPTWKARRDMVLLDVADLATQRRAGALLWQRAAGGSRFVAGSSGVEYALLPTWVSEGLTAGHASFEPLQGGRTPGGGLGQRLADHRGADPVCLRPGLRGDPRRPGRARRGRPRGRRRRRCTAGPRRASDGQQRHPLHGAGPPGRPRRRNRRQSRARATASAKPSAIS